MKDFINSNGMTHSSRKRSEYLAMNTQNLNHDLKISLTKRPIKPLKYTTKEIPTTILNVTMPVLVCPFLFQPCNQQALGAFNNQWSISRSITMYTSNVLSFATHSAVYERFHLRWFVSCEVFREIDPWPYSKWSTGREHVDRRSQHGTVSSLKYAIWSLEHDTDAV